MDFYLTEEEQKQTADLTRAAYDAWVLVNDYFSWEKEYQNYHANGSTGQIASAVFLFMKWHNVDPIIAKKMLRSEIIAREEKLCKLKTEYLARGSITVRILKWIDLLVLVTAGNFVWSMTTARYHDKAEDAYPGLRAAKKDKKHPHMGLDAPITPRPGVLTRGHWPGLKDDHSNSSEPRTNGDASSPPRNFDPPQCAEKEEDFPALSGYETVRIKTFGLGQLTKLRLDCTRALCLHKVATVKGNQKHCYRRPGRLVSSPRAIGQHDPGNNGFVTQFLVDVYLSSVR